MIRAVIFDMFETLITHYHNQGSLYFGSQMAMVAGIPEERFQSVWRPSEYDRTVGRVTLEQILEQILWVNQCYSEDILNKIVGKRIAAKEECFRHIHPEIIPMLTELRRRGLLVGLISNCFSEEAEVIRRSELLTYFDDVYLSCEQGIQKPDEEIYKRCVDSFAVKPEECVYVGDGGSNELETARRLGMRAVQATWYLQDGTGQPTGRKDDFPQAVRPLDVIKLAE